jgi:hypothetical protein
VNSLVFVYIPAAEERFSTITPGLYPVHPRMVPSAVGCGNRLPVPYIHALGSVL